MTKLKIGCGEKLSKYKSQNTKTNFKYKSKEEKSVMKENLSRYAIIQIVLGVSCILIGSLRFMTSTDFSSKLENLFIGFGLLFCGLANNGKDKSERGKIFNYAGNISLAVGISLMFYTIFLK